jgi:anti-sigma B factor antagonist
VSLSIETGTQGERTFVIALRGEVDYATAQQFREEVTGLLAGGSVKVLVVDLADVSFMDSTGVGTLVVASRICADCGLRLLLRNVNPFIARLFAVLGVAEALGVPTPAGIVAPRRSTSTPAQRSTDPLQPV